MFLDDKNAELRVRAIWRGLKGRRLVSFAQQWVMPELHFDMPKSIQNEVTSDATLRAAMIDTALPETVQRLTEPLFAAFSFTKVDISLVTAELRKMQGMRQR
jgi:hypothetical protein